MNPVGVSAQADLSAAVLALYTLYNLAATIASLPAGRLADRLGPRGPVLVLAAGTTLFLAAYLGFAAANLAVLALPFAAAGIAISCIETAQHSAVANLALANICGSAFWLHATIQAAGNVAGWMLLALAGLVITSRRPSGSPTEAANCEDQPVRHFSSRPSMLQNS